MRYTFAEKSLLAGDSERTQRRPGGDASRRRPQRLARAVHDAVDAARFEPLDGVEHELDARRFRLLVQQWAERVAGDPVRESGKVLDLVRVDDLAAGAQPLDHDD